MAQFSSTGPPVDEFQDELLDAIGEAVIATTPEGTIVYWNAAAERLYGWSKDDVLGKDILQVAPAPRMAEQAEEIMGALNRGEVWSGEFEVQRKDGSMFPALITESPVLNGEGELVRIIGVTRDLTDQRRLEGYLKEAQELAGLGIWEFDPASLTFWASRHKRKMLGLPPEQSPTLDDVMDLISPEDQDRLFDTLEQLPEHPGGHHLRYTIHRPDGDERIIESRIRFKTLANDEMRIYGTSQDVTDAHLLQEELRERARELTEAERVGQVGSWVWDIQNDVATVSRGLYALLGYEPDDGPGISYERFIEHVHPEDRDRFVAHVENMLENPEQAPDPYEFRIIRPDESIRWLEARARAETDDEGALTWLYGLNVDITQHKLMEQELSRNQSLLEETQRVASIGNWVYDLEEEKGEWSDQFYRLLGYSPGDPAEPTSEDFMARVHPEDIEQIEEAFEALLSAPPDKMVSYDHRVLLPDGSVRWLEARFKIETQQGEPVRILGKTFDTTQHKELELKLEERLRDLERRNRQIERVSMASSHPVREAVRETRINIQRLMKNAKGRLDAGEIEALEAARESSGHLEGLLESFREYIELASRPIDLEPVDLEKILDRAQGELEEAIERSGAILKSGTLPTVHTGKEDVAKVLRHLIGNAITYAGDKPPRVHVAAERSGGVWVVSVRDEGIGIDPGYHERIFQPFVRLHARSEMPGAGLGLAVSRWIIEDLGGNLWCTSKPGEGSTFYFTLPDSADEA